MFYLYIDKDTRRIIDISDNEQDIVDTMGDFLKDDKEARFLIVERTDKGDDLKGFVRGYDGYIQYIENYKLRQESCLNLKKEITKDVKIKKIKRPKK